MKFHELIVAAEEAEQLKQQPRQRTPLEIELERVAARRSQMQSAIECAQSGRAMPDNTCPNCCLHGQTVRVIPQRSWGLGNFICSVCHSLFAGPDAA